MVTSTQNRLQAREAILLWHRKLRATRPKCGAKRKHDGAPCQQLALANGRCYFHGGRTGSGKDWHKTKWPNGKAPDAEEKLARKLRGQARAAKARAKRLASMTEEQRAQHDEWQRSHRPGPPAGRAARRAELGQASWIRDLMAKDAPLDRSHRPPVDDVDIFG